MNLIDLIDRQTFPHAPGSHTSWKAARSVNLADRATKTRRYLSLLAAHGTLTDPEVVALTGWARSSLCSIRFHVEQALLVEKAGEQRKSQYGRACEAYKLSKVGMAAQAAGRGHDRC